MRETDAIDPMWEGEVEVEPGPRVAAAGVRAIGAIANRVAPFVVSWASGMSPELRLSWGARIYHLRRDGMVSVRRVGEGYDDNPRRNYNEAVAKRQERAARTEAVAPEAVAPEAVAPEAVAPEAVAPDPPALDLSAATLAEEVAKTMGITADGPVSLGGDEAPPNEDSVKKRLVAVRTLLQSLDDVADFDLVEAVDEELYLLHKAVEYKLKNHKASEAKAKLHTLFK
jgi:hypothetical protein